MDITNSVIGFVRDFGPTVWKHVKYQICPKDYERKFEAMRKKLEDRVKDVEVELATQLNQPGKKVKNEVDAWLVEAHKETTVKVEDLICKGGCLTFICSSRKLDEKTRALNEGIFMDGEKYINDRESLVMEDHSIEYCVNVFKEKQKQVKYQKEKIEAYLKNQLMQPGKIAWKEVEDWLEKASQQTAMKVEDLISQGECSSSTNIKEKIEELKRILEKGKEFTSASVSLVTDDHSKKGVALLAEKCIARDDIQEKIMELLKGDKFARIAVCGMGGVGKTAIMKQVHNQLLKEPKFSKVIWVKVSNEFVIIVQQKKQFDILKFQKRIARKLGIELKNGEQDAIDLAGLISQTLQRSSCVLILDDVWEPFSLEDVGIPALGGNDSCKLVLTTRIQQEVAHAMNCKVILVKPLDDDEALALFLDKVESVELSYPKFKSLNQILKKCNGLPLAIGVVAKTMRGKSENYSWEMVEKELSKSEELVDRLKFSYDHLEEQCKNCFLYCALYPKDHEIPKQQLIEYWIEEGFIKDEKGSRHLMNCEGNAILEKLIDNCMLKLLKNIFKEDCVSIYDLLREMALNISPQFMVKAGMALEELPGKNEWREDLLKVSLMNNIIRGIPSSMPPPKCPMLTTLLLSGNKISTIPEAFFDHMHGLKILDLSNNHKLRGLPSSVSNLKNLTTLLVKGCWSLVEVPSLSKLEGLEKLDVLGTSIRKLPQGLNMLTNLKFLHLDGRLSEIPDGLLQNLSKLQHLGVYWSIQLKGEEIGRLRALEFLHGRFSTVRDMSLLVNSKKRLRRYWLTVGSYRYLEEEDYRISHSILSGMNFIICCHIDICGKPKWLPPDVQSFYILDCNDVRSLSDISGFQDATELRHCVVDNCDGMECVVSSPCFNPLQNLESLYLYYLNNLNAVLGEGAIGKSAPLPTSTFSYLREIKVERCGKIKRLLPLSLLRYLQNLQTIEVSQCNQMEEIIWSEYTDGGEKALEELSLPRLERLVLKQLSALKSIYGGTSTVLIHFAIKSIEITRCPKIESVFWSGFNPLPTLEYLELWSLENLKFVFDEEALGLSPRLITSFSLKTIVVCGCDKLKKVFSSGRLLCYFQCLEAIEVRSCYQMEELISSLTSEGQEAREDVILPKLQMLKLYYLPKLQSICSSSSVLICDSISGLYIICCEKLKRIPLCLPSLETGQPLSLKQTQVEFWESLEWHQPKAKDVLSYTLRKITKTTEEEEPLIMG